MNSMTSSEFSNSKDNKKEINEEVYNEVKNNDMKTNEVTDSSENEIETKHFQRIVNAFKNYKLHSLKRLYRSTGYMNSLPVHQRELLKSYKSHLDKVCVAIGHNHEIIKILIEDAEHLFENVNRTCDAQNIKNEEVIIADIDKVQTIFKQIYREWSSEGKMEREASFKPILDEILQRYPLDKVKANEVRILVPGAGLGRLPYEIARNGYSCQGNEFSLFMLLTSNFILNKCQSLELYRIYPWVHQYYNNLSSFDQIQIIHFPDVNPSSIPAGSELSMAAGSFTEIYKVEGEWDCIATCFFLDTANNVIDYIETAWNILKPGGFWINLGPLLYHHADAPNENSIEPSYEDIKDIILKLGFDMIKEDTNVRTPYSQNPRSMMFSEYKSVFFVCRKPEVFISKYGI